MRQRGRQTKRGREGERKGGIRRDNSGVRGHDIEKRKETQRVKERERERERDRKV